MKNKILILSLTLITLFGSCTDNFLDEKPSKDLIVPTKLSDFQAMFDYTDIINNQAGLQIIASDNFVSNSDADIAALSAIQRNTYLWEKEVYEGSSAPDWTDLYTTILYANIVIEGLQNISVTSLNQNEWNELKGSALFYRAISYYHMAQLFAAPYEDSTRDTDMGLPIRKDANVSNLESRASLGQTYDHIIENLLEAEPLLPIQVSYKTRPSKPAVYALLARVYLTMENYEMAAHYSETALQTKGDLIDYNSLDTNSAAPFPLAIPYGNDEVIYYVNTGGFTIFNRTSTGIDEQLYQSYDENDLRRSIFFTKHENGAIRFKGSYTGFAQFFGGLATDELYVIKAEALVRTGNTQGALQSLNTLLANRYKEGTFEPIETGDADEALRIILDERRKELVARGLRWTDLRRLNKDIRFRKTLTRTFQGMEYILEPNDKRYVLPIPDSEISSSGIEQNER